MNDDIVRGTAKITVRFDHAGLHCWHDAPGRRAYLRSPHRHLFKVEVSTWVNHDDREIEFHDLLHEAKLHFESGFHAEDSAGNGLGIGRSCETMAADLGAVLARKYKRAFEVIVWEDGECGASVTSAPKANGPG